MYWMSGTPSCTLYDTMATYVSFAGPMILRDRMLQMMPNVALAIHLLNERYNPSSFWKPYIGKQHVHVCNVVDDVYSHTQSKAPHFCLLSFLLLYFLSNLTLILLSPHYQRFSHTASLFPCPSVGPTWSCCKALPASVSSSLCFFQACNPSGCW